MGNIALCENYYCHHISFKPEWLSENSWNIEYNNENNDKPYIIEKGILKIKNFNKFDLFMSKKILIHFDKISIPINFKYNLNENINLLIIFSKIELNLNMIHNIKNNNDLFFIHLIFSKNKIIITRSFDNNHIKKKFNSNVINNFSLHIENNFNLLLITEKLLKNNLKNIYEQKNICNINIEEDDECYLSLFIKNKNNINNENNFLELNFE